MRNLGPSSITLLFGVLAYLLVYFLLLKVHLVRDLLDLSNNVLLHNVNYDNSRTISGPEYFTKLLHSDNPLLLAQNLINSTSRYLFSTSNKKKGFVPQTSASFRDRFSHIELLTLTQEHNFTQVEGWPTILNSPQNTSSPVYYKNFYSKEQQALIEEISPWTWHHRGSSEDSYLNGRPDNRQNAAIVVLTRNSDLRELVFAIKQFEKRINNKFNYPYVVLNDVPFTVDFMTTLSKFTASNITFGLIPSSHWSIPEGINMDISLQTRIQNKANNVIYGDSLSYQHMCRFYSGFFYKHPLMLKYEFYWRIEPDVDYYCNIDYDPFLYMKQNNKLYSFVISLKEIPTTIPSLYEHTLRYAVDNNLSSSFFNFFSNKDGSYNLCHFWSNFEIASFKFFRSELYEKYFNYLDSTGNFYYERWGDAPIHSLAAGLFLSPDQIHFFDDIGYRHDKFSHCRQPQNQLEPLIINENVCYCPPNVETIDFKPFSCIPNYLDFYSIPWSKPQFSYALKSLINRKFYGKYKLHSTFANQKIWRDTCSFSF
ncbi:hypothetical protein BB560_002473 [Smittium megazygosporum]|uniref:Uncharacterized protein n=1 Tax=Smittium megazygosporum TaxID=133381 RepID=A0A2T9ZEP5_9FUNG|nr:hypothetical protein BB560_002473 [Smittium megazygosporum]